MTGPRTTLGPYRLQGVMARGRLGETYRALDTAGDRVVAVKVLATDPADREYRSRVEHACRTAARIRNPHVVGVHDHGLLDGRLYVVMRLVEGPDLGTVLAREGPQGPARVVTLADQVASALASAHALGLAHREVKPSNVLLTPSERGETAALADFGLAPPSGLSLDFTAPERFRGAPADHREDVYSLGCVLFTCLTGERPFPGRSLPERMRGHLEGAVPLASHRRAGVPPALDDVLATAMAKAPGDRYDTVGRFATALADALAPHT